MQLILFLCFSEIEFILCFLRTIRASIMDKYLKKEFTSMSKWNCDFQSAVFVLLRLYYNKNNHLKLETVTLFLKIFKTFLTTAFLYYSAPDDYNDSESWPSV